MEKHIWLRYLLIMKIQWQYLVLAGAIGFTWWLTHAGVDEMTAFMIQSAILAAVGLSPSPLKQETTKKK